MTPIIVAIVGFAVVILCLYVLKRLGGAVYRRKLKETISEDRKTFNSKDKIG